MIRTAESLGKNLTGGKANEGCLGGGAEAKGRPKQRKKCYH